LRGRNFCVLERWWMQAAGEASSGTAAEVAVKTRRRPREK
jgi:hypothetical protein